MQKRGRRHKFWSFCGNVITEYAFKKMLQNSQENNCDGVSFLTHFNQIFHFNTPENVRKPF